MRVVVSRIFSGVGAFVLVLLALPLVPFVVLVVRDWVYAYFGWPNTESPRGSWESWEVWVVVGVCWCTAVAVLVSPRRRR